MLRVYCGITYDRMSLYSVTMCLLFNLRRGYFWGIRPSGFLNRRRMWHYGLSAKVYQRNWAEEVWEELDITQRVRMELDVIELKGRLGFFSRVSKNVRSCRKCDVVSWNDWGMDVVRWFIVIVLDGWWGLIANGLLFFICRQSILFWKARCNRFSLYYQFGFWNFWKFE